MAKQAINTERVSAAAIKLRNVDSKINTEFSTMSNKANQLDSWKGAAGTAAQTTLVQLLNHNNARSTVLQNYIKLLEQQINPGYIEAETTNTTLADKFK